MLTPPVQLNADPRRTQDQEQSRIRDSNPVFSIHDKQQLNIRQKLPYIAVGQEKLKSTNPNRSPMIYSGTLCTTRMSVLTRNMIP